MQEDQFAKDVIELLLGEVAEAEREHEVAPAPQRADLLIVPRRGVDWHHARRRYGLLAAMIREPCIIEPFSTTPGVDDVVECLRKLLGVRHAWRRRDQEPQLWVLSPGEPRTALDELALHPAEGWPAGFALSAPALRLGLVAASGLDEGQRDTIPLRLLGRGNTRRQALAELDALPRDDPMCAPLMSAIVRFGFVVVQSPSDERSRDEQMNELERRFQAYVAQVRDEGLREGLREGRDEGLREGRDEGLRDGRQRALRTVLRRQIEARHGELNVRQQQLIDAADADALERCLERFVTATSVAEVLGQD